VFKKIVNFLVDEKGGDPVVWLVLIIIGVVLAVIVWKGLGGGIRNAAQSMSNSLSGQ
jgi:hypothetical protein